MCEALKCRLPSLGFGKCWVQVRNAHVTNVGCTGGLNTGSVRVNYIACVLQ
jgi:hypothetical protein